MKRSLTAPRIRRQSGLTSMELIVAGFLGVLLVICGGYLFTTQVRGYNSIRDQARIQADLKKALQAMTRQISTAGACLPNPRHGFSAGPEKISFSYVDVKTHFCDDPGDALTMTFYSKAVGGVDHLVQEIRCPGKGVEARTLASVPGGADLTFKYLDKNGAQTGDVNKIKAVQVDLTLETRKVQGRPGRMRKQSIQVECPNLI
jgi:hypothetical protein